MYMRIVCMYVCVHQTTIVFIHLAPKACVRVCMCMSMKNNNKPIPCSLKKIKSKNQLNFHTKKHIYVPVV